MIKRENLTVINLQTLGLGGGHFLTESSDSFKYQNGLISHSKIMKQHGILIQINGLRYCCSKVITI